MRGPCLWSRNKQGKFIFNILKGGKLTFHDCFFPLQDYKRFQEREREGKKKVEYFLVTRPGY